MFPVIVFGPLRTVRLVLRNTPVTHQQPEPRMRPPRADAAAQPRRRAAARAHHARIAERRGFDTGAGSTVCTARPSRRRRVVAVDRVVGRRRRHAARYGRRRRTDLRKDLLALPVAPSTIVMAYIVMAYIVMAYIVMTYIVMAYIVMAYIVMAYIVMAYIVMAYIVTASAKTCARCRSHRALASATRSA